MLSEQMKDTLERAISTSVQTGISLAIASNMANGFDIDTVTVIITSALGRRIICH